MFMDVLLQELLLTGAPFSSTTLPPCEAPNPVPVITTGLPTDPVVPETLVMAGAGAEDVLTDTLSNAAVASAVLFPLFTAKPTYTVCARFSVWLVPNCTQFTPSVDV
jgi:hypothetical protein